MLAHQFLVSGRWYERVGLDLIDRRGHLVVLDQVDDPVWVEIGHADELGQPLAVERSCPARPTSGC